MNHLHFLRQLFAVCTIALLSAVSAHAFEGVVSMTMTTPKHTGPITYYIKGLQMRVEMDPTPDRKGNKHTMIMLSNQETHDVCMLMVEQKMCMTYHLPDKDPQKDKKTNEIFDFKPTGRKEKIAGYDAEEYAGTSEGKRVEMWLTSEMGQFILASQGRPSQPSQWEAFMRKGNYFPLRVIHRDSEGAPEKFRMEVTHVEKNKQPDTLFQVPDDYKKVELPDIGGMLKGMIPGR